MPADAAAARLGNDEHPRLETGRKQADAISLYRAAGFAERGPFGAYPDAPMSLFLEKRLD